MPFLLWRTGWNPIVQVMMWVLEEWAWNVYPSTQASSLAVVGVYTAVLAGVWWNWGGEVEESGQTEQGEPRDDPASQIRKVN